LSWAIKTALWPEVSECVTERISPPTRPAKLIAVEIDGELLVLAERPAEPITVH
jgi:hypothetical protein